jgi:murein L,D-transpeptidase YafK
MRLTDEALAASKESSHLGFWKELQPAFLSFEASRRPATFTVSPKTGVYVLR